MKPAEVAPEWERARALLGAPEQAHAYVAAAMARWGVALEPKRGLWLAHLTGLDAGLRDRLAQRGLIGTIRLAEAEPAPAGAALLTRSHKLTASLAEALLEASLEPDTLAVLGLGRVGAWPTTAVSKLTRLALLRIRFKLVTQGPHARLLLAEEAALVALEGETIVASGELATALLAAPAAGDLAPPARARFVAAARAMLPGLLAGSLAGYVAERAELLAQDHARLRAAAGGIGRVAVEAVQPPDVIGLFTLLPAGG
jgi:hypothetical protein